MGDITLCHPRLQFLAERLEEECGTRGLSIRIGETYRMVLEQESLYAQGHTRPGDIVTNARGITCDSFHQWRTTFDFYRSDGRGAYSEEDRFFEKVNAIGEGLGLEWGGSWKSIEDKPRFQLPDWSNGTEEIKKLYKTPGEFEKTWTGKTPGWLEEEGGWRFYIGTSRIYIKDDWCKDGDNWCWFNDLGFMVHGDWTLYKDEWYHLNSDEYTARSQWVVWESQLHRLAENGTMFEGKLELKADENGALKAEMEERDSEESAGKESVTEER